MNPEKMISPRQKPNLQHWLFALLMLSCSLFAWGLTPHIKWFEHLGQPQFEQVIPQSFADCTQDPSGSNGLIVDPQQQEALDNLYTQIVSRTYIHKS